MPGPTAPLTLYALHFLGGSAREWRGVAARLEVPSEDAPPRPIVVRAIDLPGFGDAAELAGHDVAAMADHVAAAIAADPPPGPFLLAGHSMGAKVALALARGIEDGARGDLAGLALAGLVLLAGSPPGPEPMAEARRRHMLSWIDADAGTREREARGFVGQAAGAPLGPDEEGLAVADVLRCAPRAWRAWLTGGSLEDWTARIGVVATPALVVSGAEDGDLGPDAQAALMLPHLARARHEALPGAGHLLPLERPAEVAALVAAFARGLDAARPVGASDEVPDDEVPDDEVPDGGVGVAAGLSAGYRGLIASDRVNARLREALRARARPDPRDHQPRALDAPGLAVLRACVARVLPSAQRDGIDVAARIDARLAAGEGDGWRHAGLPADTAAYRLGVATLDAVARAARERPFLALPGEDQDFVLALVAEKRLPADGLGRGFGADAAALWFEDLRADVVRTYLAHPAGLARIGFTGIGAGGDDPAHLPGYRLTGLAGGREPWEEAALGSAAPRDRTSTETTTTTEATR